MGRGAFEMLSAESQAAEEARDNAYLIERALKRDAPATWLSNACRVGCVSFTRRELLQTMLAQRIGSK